MRLLSYFAAAILSGGLLTLTFAPFNLWPLGFLSLTAFAWLLINRPQNAIIISWLYGVGLFATGSSWVYVSIKVYGYTSTELAIFLVALFTGGLALFFALFGATFKQLHRIHPYFTPLLFACLWVFFEWVRSWLATGFPWLYVGYGHIYSPLAPLVPVLGVYGASFAVAIISACVAIAIKLENYRPLIIYSSSTAAVALIFSFATWTQPSGAPLKIGLVQPNFSLEEKWDKRNLSRILYQLQQQSRRVSDNDIVIWPEAAIPGSYQSLKHVVRRFIEDAQRSDYILIAGMPYYHRTETTRTSYNSQWVSNSDNLEPDFYFKQHLVPFGEYVPFESLLRGLIDFFDLPSSHFSEGGQQQPSLSAKDTPIALYICYEIAFPDLVAANASDAKLLITTSNDSWFGTSIGPKQHYQIAAMRALENSKPLARATNNGITGFIDHKGKTIKQLNAYERGELETTVQPMTGSTPFSRFGSTPIVAFCLFFISYALFSRLSPIKHQ